MGCLFIMERTVEEELVLGINEIHELNLEPYILKKKVDRNTTERVVLVATKDTVTDIEEHKIELADLNIPDNIREEMKTQLAELIYENETIFKRTNTKNMLELQHAIELISMPEKIICPKFQKIPGRP